MKRLTLTWTHPGAPDGYNVYLSKFGAPMAYEGTVVDEVWIVNNISDTDKLALGIQPFVMQDGVRVLGDVAVMNYDVATHAESVGPADADALTITVEDV